MVRDLSNMGDYSLNELSGLCDLSAGRSFPMAYTV